MHMITTLHHMTSPCITPHNHTTNITPYDLSVHYVTTPYITLHHMTTPYTTLHHMHDHSLHYMTMLTPHHTTSPCLHHTTPHDHAYNHMTVLIPHHDLDLFFFCRCFLNPGSHFIWAFIVPVLLVFFITFGFFVMAAAIMWRQQKRIVEKKLAKKIK